jgi:ATP-dependent DNA helicase RecG
MTERTTRLFKTNYPFENEKCEWKEFKSLKALFQGRSGDDVTLMFL